MAEINRPELCIVGAGALGIALAQYARGLGANVVLVDRGRPEGGDGAQRAIHLAALASSAELASQMRHGADYGLTAAEPKVSMRAVQEQAQALARQDSVLNGVERLAALGIEVVSGPTHFADPTTLVVGEVHIRPQVFVLAVGTQPILPEIPGLADVDCLTPDDLIKNQRKLTHLLVLGHAPEALALAQIHIRLGAEVTVVPQGWALDGFDIEAASIVLQALSDEGVRVLDGASVKSIQPRSQGIGATIVMPDDSEVTLDLSHILNCAGHLPDLDGLDIDAARLRTVRGQAGRYSVGAQGQTSNRMVRVVGGAAGLTDWHSALAHGRSVLEALIVGMPRRRPSALPRLVQTDPALAQIGRMPMDAKKLPQGTAIHRANLSENASLRAKRKAGGLVKVMTDKRGRITGASLAGSGAAELASVLALLMDQGISLDGLADLPMPNPSLMDTLATLSENRMAGRSVSKLEKGLGQLRRALRF